MPGLLFCIKFWPTSNRPNPSHADLEAKEASYFIFDRLRFGAGWMDGSIGAIRSTIGCVDQIKSALMQVDQ